MVSVLEENISGIDTHFKKYRIGGIDTFGIVSPITSPGALLLLRDKRFLRTIASVILY